MRYLLIQTAFLGDVILSTALIEKLRETYPEAEIDFLVKKGNERVLSGHPHLRKILLFDKKNKLKSLRSLIAEVRKANYDVVINVQRHFSAGLLTALSGAKQRIGFAKNPLSFLFTKKIKHDWNKHEVDRNQALIKDFTDSISSKPRLYPADSDWQYISDNFPQPYIIISPASLWPTKQLPLTRWADMMDRLPEDKAVYLLGGPGDKALCDELAALTKHNKTEVLAGKFSLLRDAALMSRAGMNYVLDSAPLHICSAMNAPVTAVFCSTAPSFGYGPLSDISLIVESTEKLSCRPCGAHGHKKCPEGHFKCSIITVPYCSSSESSLQ